MTALETERERRAETMRTLEALIERTGKNGTA